MRALAGPLLALFLGACSGGTPRPKNVLLVCVDTLRADQLGAYGQEPSITPRLDALAAESVVFERAHSAASWTLPSLGSTFTSQWSSTTGLWTFESKLAESFTTLPELFAARGFDTYGIASHVYFDGQYGLQQGFARFDAELCHRKGEPGWREVTSPEVTARAARWLSDRADDPDPFLLFVHLFDPHLPYLDHEAADPNDAHRSEWERYRSEIAFTDGHVGALLDALAASGHADDTLVVFFSDHGESFLEHPPINRHSYGLFEEELRVPLFVKVPGLAARRVASFVRSVDLLPTLVELFGLDDRERELRVGQSLVGALRGESHVEHPNVAEIRLKEGFHANALVSGNEKLIEDVSSGRYRLYDLAADPRERRDLAPTNPERVEALKSALTALIAEAATRGARFPKDAAVQHTPEELQHLFDLGYGGEDSEKGKQPEGDGKPVGNEGQ
ncbi:MAG: sulfatase [Planctomycetota bacterium]